MPFLTKTTSEDASFAVYTALLYFFSTFLISSVITDMTEQMIKDETYVKSDVTAIVIVMSNSQFFIQDFEVESTF